LNLQSIQKSRFFIIKYDGGKKTQTLRVSHNTFQNDLTFQNFIMEMQCESCGLHTIFVEPNLDENWFAPLTGNRRYAHYLKNGRWACGAKNWVPALAIRGMLLNSHLPYCKKCLKLKEANS
jgi:hypothetical protein